MSRPASRCNNRRRPSTCSTSLHSKYKYKQDTGHRNHVCIQTSHLSKVFAPHVRFMVAALPSSNFGCCTAVPPARPTNQVGRSGWTLQSHLLNISIILVKLSCSIIHIIIFTYSWIRMFGHMLGNFWVTVLMLYTHIHIYIYTYKLYILLIFLLFLCNIPLYIYIYMYITFLALNKISM